MDTRLPDWLATRLKGPMPGRTAQCRFEPEYCFGRHYAPPPADARRAAVLVLLYPHQGHWHLPLTVRPDTLPDHAGQVSFPGGLIERGEESHEAALRELQEELGVTTEGVVLLGQLTPLYLFVSNFSVIPWVAAVSQRPAMSPNPDEVAELIELPLAHLLDPRNVGEHQRVQNGLTYRAPHFAWGAHHIWGATSMMLSEFAAVLEESGLRY